MVARQRRTDFEGAWHHVMNRGAGSRDIFHDRDDRFQFLKLLGEAHETYGLEIHSYALMDNHFHLLVCSTGVGLGQPMRSIGGVYAQYYNYKYETDGPLFRGRYRAILVEANDTLMTVSRYIHRNPVEAGLAQSPEAYEWSSCRDFTGKRTAPGWLSTEVILAQTGGKAGSSQSHSRYRAFVEKRDLGEEATVWPPEVGMGGVGAGEPGARGAPLAVRPEIEDIARVCEAALKETDGAGQGVSGISGAALNRAKRARAMALWIARRRFGYGNAVLAERFGFGSPGTVSVTLSRFGRALAEDEALKALEAGCVEELRRWEPN